MARMSKATKERIVTILSPLALLSVWQLASNAGYIDARYVPAPSVISRPDGPYSRPESCHGTSR
jgi:ABC-type nitrate/sulfonate/bicarbonate transport system permease component